VLIDCELMGVDRRVELHVLDLQRAWSFYRDIMGAKEVFRSESRAGGPAKIGFTISKVGFTIMPHDHAGSAWWRRPTFTVGHGLRRLVCGDCHLCAGSDDRSTVRPQCWQSASPGNRVLFADASRVPCSGDRWSVRQLLGICEVLGISCRRRTPPEERVRAGDGQAAVKVATEVRWLPTSRIVRTMLWKQKSGLSAGQLPPRL